MLLVETMPVTFEILEHASPKNGNLMKIRGVLTAADEINGNGRVYPEKILDREIAKINKLIEENEAYSEGDHPADGKSRIRNTAAMLTGKIEKKKTKDRTVYVGEAVVLNTAIGKDLQAIIAAGGKVGSSSRALGTIEKGTWKGKEAEIVQEDLNIKAFDFVIGQSTKDAKFTEITEQVTVVGEGAEMNRKLMIEQIGKAVVRDLFGMPTNVAGPVIDEPDGKRKKKIMRDLENALSLAKTSAGLLPEQELTEEEKELREEMLTESFQGIKLQITEGLRTAFPEAQVLQTFPDRAIFECRDGIFVTDYVITEDGVEFPETLPTPLARVFVPKGREGEIIEVLDRERRVMAQNRRVAGLGPKPSVSVLEEDLSADMKRHRRIAGL